MSDIIIWPDVFSDLELVKTNNPASLCADGLLAWGNCFAGNKPPDSFGKTLVAISDRLGMTEAATAEGLSRHARKMGWIKK